MDQFTETVSSVVIGVLVVVGAFVYRRRQRSTSAGLTKWKQVGTVKSLMMYPLKSGRRMLLERAICTEVGLQTTESGGLYQLRDRSFVIYREDDFVFEENSQILGITLSTTENNQLTLEAAGMVKLKFSQPVFSTEEQTKTVTLSKNEKIFVLDCGDDASIWVSQYIRSTDTGLRLGYNANVSRRNLQETYSEYLDVYPIMKNNNNLSGLYSNISSYLLLTQASIDDINSKIKDQNITENNFRPNIVIDGTEPFAEDNWKLVRIGDVILYMVKYCTRCAFVTVDPETFKRNNNFEPMKTLKTYRQLKNIKNISLDGNKCVMGINMALKQAGQIQVGDIVYASEN